MANVIPLHPNPEDLTARQRNILDYVVEFSETSGYPPSIREIGDFFQIRSTNAVSDHLRALERKGWLARSEGQSRGLRVVRNPTQGAETRVKDHAEAEAQVLPFAREDNGMVDVQIIGRVAAGLPQPALEHVEDTVRVDRMLLGGAREVFGLRVIGESMIDAGILPGDYLFVRRCRTAEPGQIVVAMIDGEATVKRFFPEGDRIRLQPENPTMAPIYILASAFRSCDLVGTVVGIYRKL